MKTSSLLLLLCLLPACGSGAKEAASPAAPTAGAQPGPAPVALPSPALLVLNKGHQKPPRPSELCIVDPSSNVVVARIPTGVESHEVAVSSDGKLAVVSNTGSYKEPGHTLSVIDLATQREVKRVELGPLTNPHGLAFRDGRFWFTAEGARLVGRYDPAKEAVDWIMGLGRDSTHMLAFSKDGQKLFTANRGSASVGVVSLALPSGPGPGLPPGGGPKKHGVGEIAVGEGPEGIDVTPDGGEVWVGSRGAVTVLDAANETVVATIATGGGPVNRVKVTPDGKRALATQWNGPVMVFDVASRKEVKRIDTGGMGASILITPDGSRAYIGMTDKDRVAIVDLAKLEVVGSLATGEGPDGMAWAGK